MNSVSKTTKELIKYLNEQNKKYMETKMREVNRFDKFADLHGSSFTDEEIIDLMIFAVCRRVRGEKSNPDTRPFTLHLYAEYISKYEKGCLPNATEESYNIIKEGYESLKKELENER